MSSVARATLVLLFATAALSTRAAMRDALSATQIFNGLVDARVVRFEMPVGATDTLRKVHSVALHFDGALWLYTPGLGTRLLGPAPADAAALNTEIAGRVRELDPTLRAVQVYRRPVLPPPQDCTGSLRNGCFAGCLYELAQLLSHGEPVAAAGVVFFSDDDSAPARRAHSDQLAGVGHSMLVYQSADSRWWALDPAHPEQPFPLERLQTSGALAPSLLAYAQQSHYPLGRVRFLSISDRALADLSRGAHWRAFRESSPIGSDSTD